MNTHPHATRRRFLCTTALAALAAKGGAASNEPNGKWIDAHVHVWTPDLQRYPLASGFKTEEMQPVCFTPEELFAQCKPEDVGRVVLIQMSFYQFDNRYLLDTIAQHKGAFHGVAIIDETKPNVTETMKTMANQGIRGFRLYTEKEKAEAWLTSGGMKQMWSQAADSGQAMCLLANPDALPAVGRMCKAFPKTRVVIDHFARIGMKSSVNQSDLDNLCRLAEHGNVFVKTSAFYALGEKKAPYTDLAPMIRKLRATFGASRLMWGSDCPFQVQDGHTYANSIALIRDRLDFLSAEDRQWMLHGTAEQVFFGQAA